MARITKRAVDGIDPGPKDRYLWDDELTGFGLKVTPAGRKVFLIQYRIGGRKGRTRRVTLGTLGPITADEARTRAKDLLGATRQGLDPAADRDRQKLELSFGAVIDRFLTEHVRPKLKARSAEEYERVARLYLKPNLRSRSVTDIKRADIGRLHHELADKPYQANRLLAVLSKMFNWAERNGLRPAGENPCRHIDKFSEARRERFLSDVELGRLGRALNASDQDVHAIAAIQLLVFTGARLNEILTLRWDWIDAKRGTIRLPDSKTGAKTLYLNPPALKVLQELPRVADNPFVIVGDVEGAHRVNLQKPWRVVRAAAKLNDVRLHDLRHTFASVGAGGNMSLRTIGALLGHSQPQTTDRYAHLASDPMRAASDTIGNRISAAMVAGDEGAENILPLPSKKRARP